MKVVLSVVLLFLSLVALPQFGKKMPLEYSKVFDSYYRKGPLKFQAEPGVSILNGDLSKSPVSYALGISASYQVNAPVEPVLGFRYFGLSASEGGISTSGSHYQFNTFCRYFLRYDRVRTNYDRRRGPRFWHLYLMSGFSFTRYNTSANTGGRYSGWRINIPLALGIPFRVSDRIKLIPEVTYYHLFTDAIDGLQINTPSDRYFVASFNIQFNPSGKRKNNNMRKRGRAVEDDLGTGGSSGSNADSPSTPKEDDSTGDIVPPESHDESDAEDPENGDSEPETEDDGWGDEVPDNDDANTDDQDDDDWD